MSEVRAILNQTGENVTIMLPDHMLGGVKGNLSVSTWDAFCLWQNLNVLFGEKR